MRMHFANASQCVGLIRSSLQTRANFSSCVHIHDSPRGISTLSSVSIGGSGLNGPRVPHTSLGCTTQLEIKTTDPFSSNEPWDDLTRSIIHPPNWPDEEFSYFTRHLDSRARKSQKGPVIRRVLSINHRTKGPDEESSYHQRYLNLVAVQPRPSSVRKVQSWTPWYYSDIFYPAKTGGIGRHVRNKKTIVCPGKSEERWIHLDLSRFQYLDVDKPKDSCDKFLFIWTTRYAVIVRGIWVLKPWKLFLKMTFQRLITPRMDREAIRRAWSNFPVENLDETWREYMLWALQHSPIRALKVLNVAILDGVPYIPRYVLSDCLDYLVAFYVRKHESPHPLTLDLILHLTCKFMRDSGFPHRLQPASVSGRTLFLILSCCKNNQARTLWDTVEASDIELAMLPLLSFLSKFRKMADMSRCMEVIRKASRIPSYKAHRTFQYQCAQFLRVHFGNENWSNVQAQIRDWILETGIRPSIKLFNIMIKDCVLADECDAALTLYKIARDQKVMPNSATYSYLLKGIKRGWSFDVLDLVVRDTEADGQLYNSDYLVFQVLLLNMHLDFPEFLQVYWRYCDIAPLYEFGILKRGPVLLNPAASSRPPSSRAVALMIRKYIIQNPTSPEVVDLYKNYCALVHGGNPHAIFMARSDYVWHHFLWAFGKHAKTLEYCMIVIRTMLRPTLPSPKSLATGTDKIQQPTVISWTLLLQAFCRHNQMIAAEKVMTMMREREVEPNEMTWSILIYGYAAAQNIDGAMSAVERMKAAGFPVTDYIVSALGQYQDRQKLLERLDDTIKADSGPEDEVSEDELDEPDADSDSDMDEWEDTGEGDWEPGWGSSFEQEEAY